MAVFVFAIAIQAQTKSERVEQELIKLGNGWNDATVKPDWPFIDWILANDSIGTNTDPRSSGLSSVALQILILFIIVELRE